MAELTLERDNLLASATEQKSQLRDSIHSLKAQLDGAMHEKDRLEHRNLRAEQAHRIERRRFEEQVARTKKHSDSLEESLAKQAPVEPCCNRLTPTPP